MADNDGKIDGDAFFDQWLMARKGSLKSIARSVIRSIEQAERTGPNARIRKRREEDLKTFHEMVDCIIANLAHSCIMSRESPVPIVMPRSKHHKLTRYDRPIFRQAHRTLEIMADCGYLEVWRSRERAKASTIRPTLSFDERVQSAGVNLSDFGRKRGEELIVLKQRPKGDTWKHGADGGWHWSKGASKPVDYARDTKESRRFRREVATINRATRTAVLTPPPPDDDGTVLDTSKTTLYRIFNLPPKAPRDTIRFDRGGRLFHGWWQNISQERRADIKIDGEAVVELDYDNMFPRLAYASVGAEPPEGDLYSIPGLDAHRGSMKILFNAFMFVSSPKTRRPEGVSKASIGDVTVPDVKRRILAHHQHLKPIFEKGVGLSLMFTESQIMVALLLRLAKRGIIGLSVHDGLVVPKSSQSLVLHEMHEAAEEVCGVRLPASLKV